MYSGAVFCLWGVMRQLTGFLGLGLTNHIPSLYDVIVKETICRSPCDITINKPMVTTWKPLLSQILQQQTSF